MPASRRSPEMLIAILNALVTTPVLTKVAKQFHLSAMVLYQWQALSAQGHPDFDNITWMEQTGRWDQHLKLAKRLSALRIDEKIRDLSVNGHTEKLFNNQTGQPVWKVDPKIVAEMAVYDAATINLMYYDPPYVHDENNGRIQEEISKPPNPQLLIKAASSLLPEIYGERIEHSVTVCGVLRLGGAPAAPIKAIDASFEVLTESPEQVLPPKNVLAVAAPCQDVAEYEATFGGKRLVEAELFYNEDGTLQPPRSEIVIVEGSEIDRAYSEANIRHHVTSPASLIAQGYVNRFLKKLVPESELDALEQSLQRLAAIHPASAAELRARLAALPRNPLPSEGAGRRTIPSVKGTRPDDGNLDDRPSLDARKDHCGHPAPLPGGARVA
jgi:hypothetical protein